MKCRAKSAIQMAFLCAVVWIGIRGFTISYMNPELTQMQVFQSVLFLD